MRADESRLRALCAGFGSVEALERLAAGFDGSIVGIDTDAKRVRRTRAALAERGACSIDLQAGSLTSIPFPDGWFDLIDCTAILHEVRCLEDAFHEMARVLAPGGEIRIVDFRSLPRARFRCYQLSCFLRTGRCPDIHPGFHRENLVRPASACGLRETEYRELDRPWRLGSIEAQTFLLRLTHAD